MPRKWRWYFKCNYCDSIALEKEPDHHEESDDESQYDCDNHLFSDSEFLQSEADSHVGCQKYHPVKLVYFI